VLRTVDGCTRGVDDLLLVATFGENAPVEWEVDLVGVLESAGAEFDGGVVGQVAGKQRPGVDTFDAHAEGGGWRCDDVDVVRVVELAAN